jgi:hypothetical protein
LTKNKANEKAMGLLVKNLPANIGDAGSIPE